MPERVMEKERKETLKTMHQLNQSWYETYQSMAHSAFEVQSQTMQYAQNVFLQGLETLKSHLDASPRWFEPAGRSQGRPEAMSSLMEGGIEAYKRNVTFLQKTVEQGVQTFEHNTQVLRDLTETLLQKAQERQEIWWSQTPPSFA